MPTASRPGAATIEPLDLIEPAEADRRLLRPPAAPAHELPAAAAPAAAAAAGERRALHEMGVADLLAAFRRGATTPADVCAALTARIGRHPSGPEAVLSLLPVAAAAEESGRRYAAGTARALEGIPVGVKAIVDVAGAAVTCGSHLTDARIAPADAAVVARLRESGAIPFAMLATTEFATGSPDNPRHGRVCNPYDRRRWTGGSSTGSGAALAARLLPFAIGTDTGGSIRVPSAWCGTSGLKPTRERVSRRGVACLSFTLDHVGPMARSVADLALCFPGMADAAPLVPRSLAGLRIGIAAGWFAEAVSRDVATAFAGALDVLEQRGATIRRLALPDIAPFHAMAWTILFAELAALYRPFLHRRAAFDDALLDRLDRGLAIGAAEYIAALQGRVAAQDALLAAMADVDLMLTPGVGGTAGRLDTRTVAVDDRTFAFQDIVSRNTMIFDYTGCPALMLPTGTAADGLPVAMQIVGRPFADDLCLAADLAFQDATAFHRRAPPEPDAAGGATLG